MAAKDIHPNLVKRPQRARATMVGRRAYYIPNSIMVNNTVPINSAITILEFSHKEGKDLSLVKVETSDGNQTTVLFSDLAFIG